MLKDFFLKEVEDAINKAIKSEKLGQMGLQDEYNLIIEKPKNPEFGDFAVNVSSLARMAKIAPPMIANAIVECLPQTSYTVSVVGGFINFKIKDEILSDIISEILDKKENYGKNQVKNKEKILLEYVSANPTGPFHIGHGRWAASNIINQQLTDVGPQWEVHWLICSDSTGMMFLKNSILMMPEAKFRNSEIL